ncbi:MAG: Gfo/Idh/MocA family oxidoreductase [Verrucomicrobia bacterium]|nr:Gfo/Idh/MocA family oxidoreductase [Verrucomicrobiota bacterium]
MNVPIRWGILGAGRIARKFAAALQCLPDARLEAVGSRAKDRAHSFGAEFNIPRCHSEYSALAHDPQVDAVYVATRHSSHAENTLLALSAGKAVLCEKPFALNASEAEEMIASARQKKLFLMEALWTRFFPLMAKLREMLRQGAIGEVRMLTADFGFRAPLDPNSRLFNPADGGGALLDVGIYPISLASMIFGPPVKIASMAQLGRTGVDEESAMLLQHAAGQIAVLMCAVRTNMPQEAVIMGTEGQIRIHSPWWRPTAMSLIADKGHQRSQRGQQLRVNLPLNRPISLSLTACVGSESTLDFPYQGNGYQYEAAEVMCCLREGRIESETMPLAESLSIMRTLDTIRSQWSLKYPQELAKSSS